MPSKPPAPSDLADKFMLRLPDGMRDRIADAAKANNRSMNAEIVARLAYSFEIDGIDLVKLNASVEEHGRLLDAFLKSQGNADAQP